MDSEAVVEQKGRTEICSRHGEYMSQHRVLFGHDYGWTACPTCTAEEREAALQREELERQEALTARRIERANIPPRFQGKTLENFQTGSDEQRVALDLARSYVIEFRTNLEAGRCLVFCGTPGTGKTHLACGMAYALAKDGWRTKYTTVSELIRGIRETWRPEATATEGELLTRLRELDLLVLDEVGAQFGTEAEKVQLFDVISSRYNAMKPTIVISNLDLDGLKTYLGERAVDRLRENGGRMLVLMGASWRATQNQ